MDRSTAVELVRGLVAIPSLSRHEAGAATWLAEQMRAYGFDRAYVDGAGNAVGEIGNLSASRTIVMLGHIDTVPGNIPVRIDGGRDEARCVRLAQPRSERQITLFAGVLGDVREQQLARGGQQLLERRQIHGGSLPCPTR